jgi:hypothetical protein
MMVYGDPNATKPSAFEGLRYPDFLCIGAQKAGTTWLDSNLRKLPKIWLPPIKELHYFNEVHSDDNRKWTSIHRRTQGIRALGNYLKSVDEQSWNYEFIARTADIVSGRLSDEWYGNIFSLAAPEQICGEITPAYSILPPVGIEHIVRLMPNVKIIMILRDPIERSWSQLRMLAAEKGQSDPAALIRFAASPQVFGRSNYPQILRLWSRHFDQRQVLVVDMDEIVSHPRRVLTGICEFLETDFEGTRASQLSVPVHVGNEMPIPREVYVFLKEQMLPLYESLKGRYPEMVGKWANRHYGGGSVTP